MKLLIEDQIKTAEFLFNIDFSVEEISFILIELEESHSLGSAMLTILQQKEILEYLYEDKIKRKLNK